MSQRAEGELPEGLSDQDLRYLLGPKGIRDVTEAIATPEDCDGTPNPVRANPYYDVESKKMKLELDSRGIGISESLAETEGITRITEAEFEEARRDIWVGMEWLSHNNQSDLSVHVTAIQIWDTKSVFLETQLMPNTHSLESRGSRYYQVDVSVFTSSL